MAAIRMMKRFDKQKEPAALSYSKAAGSKWARGYVCYTTAFFFCRRPVDHSIFMKLGAWQIHGEKYLHQLPKRVVLPGLPISHTAYRYSFVPPTGAK